jgi:small subunit ribosomal protein S20
VNILPNIKSAKKRVEIAQVRAQENSIIKTSLKTSLKKFKTSLDSNDDTTIKEAYASAVSTVDKAVSKGVIKKNTANNKKASLGKQLSTRSK